MSNLFNQDALNTNRQGRLTLSQALGLIPLILIGGIIFLIASFFPVGIIYGLITHTFKGSLLVAVIFGGGISLALFWVAYLVGGTRLIDMLMGQVRHVEGRGMKYSAMSSSGSRSGMVRYYSVGEKDFQIPFYGAWKTLHDEPNVRAYYTPLSKSLVNIERLFSEPSTYGNFKPDEELEGLKKLGKAEMEAKQQIKN